MYSELSVSHLLYSCSLKKTLIDWLMNIDFIDLKLDFIASAVLLQSL